MKMNLEINLKGNVLNDGVHDAAIIGINTMGEGKDITNEVLCRAEDGTKFVFKMTGVRVFNISFYGPQNIISDCTILNQTDASAALAEIRDLEKYTFNSIASLKSLILNGDLTLFQINPSVGAAIDCICSSVSLETIS